MFFVNLEVFGSYSYHSGSDVFDLRRYRKDSLTQLREVIKKLKMIYEAN